MWGDVTGKNGFMLPFFLIIGIYNHLYLCIIFFFLVHIKSVLDCMKEILIFTGFSGKC